ncbi:MAG: efflux transporter periplasmic adaptor subunit [Bacteroidetes bacterium 43-93]|nr:efflux RND transporter periplasmic adaptor subunit [Bacteroidota bacterium]OJX00449.1 MAG: efflux transporter periplasmic adaptor subunit [Bacteroidetes bacterium 43-93]
MKYTFVILSLFIVACSQPKKQEAAVQKDNGNTVVLTDQQYKNAGLEIGHAEKKTITNIIKVTGKIDVPPQNMVSVSFPLGGYLKSTKLLPGMHVSKGEVIAIMEDPQYIQLQQDYLTAKARQDYLEKEYLRQKDLNKTKATSDKVYQQSEADYRSNKILISSLQQKLLLIGINPSRLDENNISRTVNVFSPIDGFVSQVDVNIGKYVTPSDVLFELVNPTDIHLALTVFEKDLDKLYIGQKLVAYSNANPDKKYPCEIILIGKDVSAERSVQVHCHFEQYDHTLVPGMYMNAEIETKSDDAIALPEDAIVNYENKHYIFVPAGDKRFEMKEVTTGATENGYVAVTANGIDLINANVVKKNAYTLLMKLKNTANED